MVEHMNIIPKVEVVYSPIVSPPDSLLMCIKVACKNSMTQLDKIEAAMQKAFTEQEFPLIGILTHMIKDQKHEIALYNREILALTNVDSDPTYVQLRSEKLHSKYKKMQNKYSYAHKY